MVTEAVRARLDRRSRRGRSRWSLAWPGIAGCAILVLEAFLRLLFADRPFLMGFSLGMAVLPGLLLWTLGCFVAALGEAPPFRQPALLANGAFLLATAAILWALAG